MLNVVSLIEPSTWNGFIDFRLFLNPFGGNDLWLTYLNVGENGGLDKVALGTGPLAAGLAVGALLFPALD